MYIYIYMCVCVCLCVYPNLPDMSQSDHPILGAETAKVRKRFKHPLLTSKPRTMTQTAQTTIPIALRHWH